MLGNRSKLEYTALERRLRGDLRALFALAGKPDREDQARKLLAGPEGWAFDCT